VIHLVAASGLTMVAIGGSEVSLRQPWIGTGLVLYAVAAYVIEARALPAERELARSVAGEGPVELDVARRLSRRLDAALALVAAAAIVMLWQF
jgi:hypothetical protein